METATALGTTPEVDVDLGGGVKMTMVLIPAGASTLGSPAGTPGAEGDEVLKMYTQMKPFFIGKTVFTREMYKAVMGSFPVQPPNGVAHALMMTDSVKQPAIALHPVVRTMVMPALQMKAPAGWTFRLPVDNEWEYAARAGTGTIWYSGDDPATLDTIAWTLSNYDNTGTLHDVALKLPNAWGLYDMIGNDSEWAWYPNQPNYGDNDPQWHLIRSCQVNDMPYGNGCRTSNRNISDTGVSYRFMAEAPVP
jgi:formylglycine-generating enzyme required for sulfatase activity